MTDSEARIFDRLDHVTIAVADLAAAQRKYVTLLGRSPAWQEGAAARGARGVRFRLANTQIELATPDGPDGKGERGDALRSQLDTRGEGLHAIALGTADLATACKHLREAGIEVPEPHAGISQDGPSGAWMRWQACDLPRPQTGGVRIELIELRSPDEEIPPSLPIGDEAATVGHLDHVVIFSDAADATRALYADALGIRLALDKEFPKRNARILFFRVGGATIEIGTSLDANEPLDPTRRDRLWGLAHQVADIDAAHARLLAAGIESSAVRDGHKRGTRVFSVKDGCHGVPTLMIEPVGR